MSRQLMFIAPLVCLLVGPGAAPARAQSAAPAASPVNPVVGELRAELERLRQEFESVRRQYGERLLALEDRIARIGAGPAAPDAPVVPPPGAEPAPPAAPGAPAPPQAPQTPTRQVPQSTASVFNPDTSVIGNMLAVGGKNPFAEHPALGLSEVEVAFQSVIDPYARGDFYLSVGPEGLEIEEGFITFTALPGHLLLKAGRMRAQFGKVNTLHTHNVPGADRPLVSRSLLGGDEGLADTGLSLSHLVQNRAVFLELTGEVFRGDSPVFQSAERTRLSYVGRVRTYRDLTEAANLDLGASFATGPAGAGHAHGADDHRDGFEPPDFDGRLDRRLAGVDATFRWRPLRQAANQRVTLRSELIWSRQELPDGDRTRAFGVYGLGEIQVARRWHVGARIDRSGRPWDGSIVDTGGALFVTFRPSEFSLIRGQYRRVNFAEGRAGNELLFQFNFSIGAHGAHVF